MEFGRVNKMNNNQENMCKKFPLKIFLDNSKDTGYNLGIVWCKATYIARPLVGSNLPDWNLDKHRSFFIHLS